MCQIINKLMFNKVYHFSQYNLSCDNEQLVCWLVLQKSLQFFRFLKMNNILQRKITCYATIIQLLAFESHNLWFVYPIILWSYKFNIIVFHRSWFSLIIDFALSQINILSWNQHLSNFIIINCLQITFCNPNIN